MLNHLNHPPSASPGASQKPFRMSRTLRDDLLAADDTKIRQIVGLSEESPQADNWQLVLDPIRARLALLQPPRALRFTRLLFIPLEDLLVPAPDWRPGRATIPRSVLKPIAATVRTALGDDMAPIERLIAGHNTYEAETVTRAGGMLWGPAGEILARAPPPANWEETGLPPATYAPLARGMATVLRRAVALRSQIRDVQLGALEPNQQAVEAIVLGLAGEPPDGCAMVFKLLLGHFPHAGALLRRLAEANPVPAERSLLQAAMDRGIDDILVDLEGETSLIKDLREGNLSGVGLQVERLAGLLQDIGDDRNAVRHRARLRGIRDKLDSVCRDRFADGMKRGLVAPLAGASPVDQNGQKQLENCARELRTVEIAGRKLGTHAAYDALLEQAAEAVQAGADAGNLTPIRAVRLVEILSGPEAAEQMYNKVAAK
jgi:hypothetical protein